MKPERYQQVEKLRSRVDQKIGIIISIGDFLKKSENLSAEDFANACDLESDKIAKVLGLREEDIAKIEERFKKEEELQQLTNQWINLIGQKNEEMLEENEEMLEEPEELSQLETQMDLLREEIENISLSDSEIFWLRVKDFFEHIKTCHHKVSQYQELYQQNKEAFFNQLLEDINTILINHSYQPIAKEDINKIELIFTKYSVNLILPEELYQEIIGRTSIGLHLGDSVYNFIEYSPSQEKISEVIRHEEGHTIYEFLKLSSPPIDYIFEQIHKVIKIGAPLTIKESIVKRLKASIIIFPVLREVLAQIDFPAYEIAEPSIFEAIYQLSDIKNRINEIEDNELKQILRNHLIKIEDEIIKVFQSLINILIISEHYGILEKAKAAIILFAEEGQNGLRKIERYLASEVGVEIYDLIKLILPIVNREILERFFGSLAPDIRLIRPRRFLPYESSYVRILQKINDLNNPIHSFLYPRNVERFVTLLRRIENKGDRSYLDKISSLMQEIRWRSLIDEDYEDFFYEMSFQEFLNYTKAIEEIAAKINSPHLKQLLSERLSLDFFSARLRKAIEDDDFVELKEIYQEWPYQKEKVKDIILMWISQGFVFQDYGYKYDENNIENSKFWQFVKEIGLEKEAGTSLEEYKKYLNE